MRSLILCGAHDARLLSVDEPAVAAGQVKIRVECAGICGSDLSLYQHAPIPADVRHPLLRTDGPHALGHEFAGRIVEVGDGVDDLELGTLVAVRPNVWCGACPACRRGAVNLCATGGFIGVSGGGGGFSDLVVAGRDAVYPMPDELGAEVAALVEPTAVAWHAVGVSAITSGATALVIGTGPVGLALVIVLRARGAETVYVSEPSPVRAELARRLGATVLEPADVAEQVRRATAGVGVDVAFDASGLGQVTYDAAVESVRPGGTSVVVAMFHEPVSVDLRAYMTTEKRLVGSMAYTADDFAAVVDAVVAGDLDPRPLITARISLDDVVSGGLDYLLGEGRSSEIKILVRP